MGMERHADAHLEGWSGPFYASATLMRRLVEAAYELRPAGYGGGQWLEQPLRSCPGYVRRFRQTAADGYGWFWMFEFKVSGGRVAIALPWRQEWKDGRRSVDRSPALYTRGWRRHNIGIDVLAGVVTRAIEALVNDPNLPAADH